MVAPDLVMSIHSSDKRLSSRTDLLSFKSKSCCCPSTFSLTCEDSENVGPSEFELLELKKLNNLKILN